MVDGGGETLGTHWMLRASGCDGALLSDPTVALRALNRLVEVLRLTAVSPVVSRSHEGAVVAFVLLAESHASVHTDPVDGSLFADVFSCGAFVADRASDVFLDHYHPVHLHQTTVIRGPTNVTIAPSNTILSAKRGSAHATEPGPLLHLRGTYRVIAQSSTPHELAARLGLIDAVASHTFEPQGQSVAWSSEHRRLAVHTWPELGLVTIDLHARPPIELDRVLAQCGWTATDVRPPDARS